MTALGAPTTWLSSLAPPSPRYARTTPSYLPLAEHAPAAAYPAATPNSGNAIAAAAAAAIAAAAAAAAIATAYLEIQTTN